MILLIILGMALVTALPRVMPAMIVDKLIFPVWVNRWLEAIPYAALGALIFPAILSVKEGEPHVGLIGGLVALFLALFRLNIIIVVIGAILTVYLLSL
ncbi:MAG TPA: AzlD domain-containing protein [Pseudogracilibacillus sp.]|nr:AzlD domain-containing protein [Pseudogracilibacillus sp.]